MDIPKVAASRRSLFRLAMVRFPPTSVSQGWERFVRFQALDLARADLRVADDFDDGLRGEQGALEARCRVPLEHPLGRHRLGVRIRSLDGHFVEHVGRS